MEIVNSSATMHKRLNSLTRAVFQIETSTMTHCRHEAEYLGQSAPADALLAIAAHAEGSLSALPAVCARDELLGTFSESAAGLLFSQVRERLADLFMQSERTYRETLLGLRHGVDLMRFTSVSASAARKAALAEFCSAWLTTRMVLLQRAEAQLFWFALHADKGADQRWLGERYGRVSTGPALHPLTRETGFLGASNVGQDETSGSE